MLYLKKSKSTRNDLFDWYLWLSIFLCCFTMLSTMMKLLFSVAFIRGFSKQMAKFDCDYDIASAKSRRMYAIPPHIKDPLVVLLLFRRNITGSTL